MYFVSKGKALLRPNILDLVMSPLSVSCLHLLWLFANMSLSITFLCFCCFWDLPLSLSCFRNKSGEGASECASSQWVTLTLAIADKRTPLICTQKVIIKHSPNIFNEKNLCIKMLLLSLGTSFQREPWHHLFWRPMGKCWKGPMRWPLLEVNLISAEMPTTPD